VENVIKNNKRIKVEYIISKKKIILAHTFWVIMGCDLIDSFSFMFYFGQFPF